MGVYKVEKKYDYGYVILPCFTCRLLKGTHGAELICNSVLQWIFTIFFAPFWDGAIHITREE